MARRARKAWDSEAPPRETLAGQKPLLENPVPEGATLTDDGYIDPGESTDDDGGSYAPPQPAGAGGTVVRAGSIQLPAGSAVRPVDLQVLSAFEEAPPDADGGFDILVAESRSPQFVFTLDPETDHPVLVGYSDPAGGALEISFESTAVSLAFLSPIMMGTPAQYRVEFIEAVKAHPDFPLLVAAVEAGFRADPQRLLDPEANPDIYRQAAELSIGAWEGMVAAGKPTFDFRRDVPTIADEDSTGQAITFVNPMFVYYVARIATADQALADEFLEHVTVSPVPQALDLALWDLPGNIVDLIRERNIDALRESASKRDYELADGHFEIYLTKGFSAIDGNPLNTANGRATLWNISRAIILVLQVGTELVPGVGDVAENLFLEGDKGHQVPGIAGGHHKSGSGGGI